MDVAMFATDRAYPSDNAKKRAQMDGGKTFVGTDEHFIIRLTMSQSFELL
jgi:hypothetical protein